MRHGKKVNHLGRTAPHRKAMLANMATSLILHKRINTTLAKAKALRTYVEPLITKSKSDTTHSRRTVFAYIKDKFAVSELFKDISVKVADRPGGYTRIIKTGNRLGDNAEMAMIELVDYNEVYLKETKVSKGGAKKSRRGGAKKKADAPVAAAVASPAVEKTETKVADKVTEVETKAAAAPVVEVSAEVEAPVEVPAVEETPTEPQVETKAEEATETPVAESKTEAPAEEEKKDDTEEEKKD
jgi:large subunit ribosomal protein L17